MAVTARTPVEVKETARLCQAAGVKAYHTTADSTRAAEVRAALVKITRALGAPSVLVNNAGIARSEAFLKTDEALMGLHWQLNVMGAFYASQAVLPGMLKQKWGRVVNIASVAGKVGAPYIAAYAASKHGLLGLTRSMAAEFAHTGITVNAVCPGYVDTMLTKENIGVISQKTGMSKAEAKKRLEAMSPQGRLTSPEEVAVVVAFLCSRAAGNINGQALTIDGGALQW